jgi:D-arabinose 1-dehydrogenase-like Zn-dependent alcohol dehydrogenase
VRHSDSFTIQGQWPKLSFPRIPEHEIAGVIGPAMNKMNCSLIGGMPFASLPWQDIVLQGVVT